MDPGGPSWALVYLCLGLWAFLGQCHIVHNAPVDICLIGLHLLWVSVALRKDEPGSLTTKFPAQIKSKGAHRSAVVRPAGPRPSVAAAAAATEAAATGRTHVCSGSHRPWGNVVPSVSQF